MQMKFELSRAPLVNRRSAKIERDISRVITRLYMPGNMNRVHKIISRVLKLKEQECDEMYEKVALRFYNRHKNLDSIFIDNFKEVSNYVDMPTEMKEIKKLLIGAYFTMEYSIESAAIFNPSIIMHPDQSGVPKDCQRFIMSLRATGEGHISSIVFRTGIIDESISLTFDPITSFASTPKTVHNRFYNRDIFEVKLKDIGAWNKISKEILNSLPEKFSFQDLRKKIDKVYLYLENKEKDETIDNIYWIANSNYFKLFDTDSNISERVIFPVSDNEIGGIEDARFVKFVDEKGDSIYYATYTANNGKHTLPHLLETKDFLRFNIATLNGDAAQNKGMALFPRKVNGKYAMLSRLDGENNYIMYSDNIHFWDQAKIIQEPQYPWEFIQLGNCGSPIETEYGWLVLTHGVGPVRQYSIGAILLDLNNPEKVIKKLENPLLTPNETEREGYVPNVVYSCGSIIHNKNLIIPYAMSDITSGIVTVNIKDLIDNMIDTDKET